MAQRSSEVWRSFRAFHARSVFSEWISRPDAAEAIDSLAMLAQRERVAVP